MGDIIIAFIIGGIVFFCIVFIWSWISDVNDFKERVVSLENKIKWLEAADKSNERSISNLNSYVINLEKIICQHCRKSK